MDVDEVDGCASKSTGAAPAEVPLVRLQPPPSWLVCDPTELKDAASMGATLSLSAEEVDEVEEEDEEEEDVVSTLSFELVFV